MQWRFDRRETIQIAKAWIDLLLQRLAVKIKTPVLEVHIPIEIRRSLVLLAISMLAVGCEPKDVRPGFWLGGEDVSSRVEDWQYTDQIDEVFIQSKSGYVFEYDYTNNKVLAYQGDNANAAAAPLIEVADLTDLATLTGVRIMVIGRI